MNRVAYSKPKALHWWIVLGAVLFGIALFFAFHLEAY